MKELIAPAISIIIPMYGVEAYILQCIESVYNQTYTDYECIIINDGTKDNSAGIVQKYIAEHELQNFKLVNKNNGGVCSARNTGLEIASGNWIYFLDGDDWIEPDALKKLIELACKEEYDLIIGGYRAYNQETGNSERWGVYPSEKGKLQDDLDKLCSFSYCWGRLYKRSIIEEHHIRFDERIEYGEDNAWQFDYLQYIKQFACTNDTLYNYRYLRINGLTFGSVLPKNRKYIAEHMYRFFNCINESTLISAVNKNKHFNRVVWSVAINDATNNILVYNYNQADRIRESRIIRESYKAYTPKQIKDKAFHFLWGRSFPLLCLFVHLYYWVLKEHK